LPEHDSTSRLGIFEDFKTDCEGNMNRQIYRNRKSNYSPINFGEIHGEMTKLWLA
jgi:hypothetical protein